MEAKKYGMFRWAREQSEQKYGVVSKSKSASDDEGGGDGGGRSFRFQIPISVHEISHTRRDRSSQRN